MAIQGKYINLFTDFGFKRVFGEEANKDILMDFLNQILPKDYIIKDLQFSKNEHLGQGAENRKAIFDVYCISAKGEHFIVELQKARQDYFKDRSVYYASFPIQEMAKKGKTENGEWNYELNPVFTIGILNFAFKDEITDADKLYHHVQLKDQDCHVFYDKLHFIYLELSKFNKELKDCITHYDKWLWVFKNLPIIEDIPTELQQTTFIKLFNISEVAKFDKKERDAYQTSLKHLWDLTNVVNTAFKEGREEGREEGLKEGQNIGVEITLQTIRLYSDGNSIAIIGEKLNKSTDFIKNILEEAGFLK
ncbi:MAG: Rpn family recombination-promoting nuclease/putative transposase [Saprospiraceae bacterium]